MSYFDELKINNDSDTFIVDTSQRLRVSLPHAVLEGKTPRMPYQSSDMSKPLIEKAMYLSKSTGAKSDVSQSIIESASIANVSSSDHGLLTGDVVDEADNCAGIGEASYSDVSAPGICPGSTVITRTWTLTDVCGNVTNQDQIITKQDDNPPTFTVPPDVNVSYNPLYCKTTPVFADNATNIGFDNSVVPVGAVGDNSPAVLAK